ncbi:hypothetical protein HF329_00670 [Chitinophaga oryzae]|uniref:CHAT domain-containing protein n=1 Tax=Chitinophaga oryzae TaxID=2725414 RepID=A0AAE7D6C0_9BACT|nr:hypothetical protein [Chitinophaga oryzae]QJB29896.1 hypothetical protein HF329_00670 [Chitinophaga oryzae]
MNNIPVDDALLSLKQYIREEVLLYSGDNVNRNQIDNLIDEIADCILSSYENQRKYTQRLLSIYDEFTSHVLEQLLKKFLLGLECIKKLTVVPLNLNHWDSEDDYEKEMVQYKSFFSENIIKRSSIRLSYSVDWSIDEAMGMKFLSLIHSFVRNEATKIDPGADDINALMLHLWVARNISRAIKKGEFFYFIMNLFFDGLHISQNYQLSRDIVEECLICSYLDDAIEYGNFLSFKVYGCQGSSVAALHYGILANKAFLEKSCINEHILKSFYWESIKFTRNINLIPYAKLLFENRPQNVTYKRHEQNKFYNTYFSILLHSREDHLPDLVLEYLDTNKDNILVDDEGEAMPWLAILFNIKRNYTEDKYDEARLNYYVSSFKNVISPANYDKLYTSLFGNLGELEEHLRNALKKLAHTRSSSDFVTDNTVALQISHRNILESFVNKDVDGYLLSMILQSDFTIFFKEKEVPQYLPIGEAYHEIAFEEMYIEPKLLRKHLEEMEDVNVLWLGGDNHKVLPLFFSENGYTFITDKDRYLNDIYNFANEEIDKLPLSTQTIGKSRREKFVEDYELEETYLREKLEFFNLPCRPLDIVLIIKDIDLSIFPHNLVTCSNEFLCKKVPVSNVMSLEWFVKNRQNELSVNPSISAWIPVNSMDIAISMMYSKMDEYFKRLMILEEKDILPKSALNSDINILVAHGSEEISTFPAFYLKAENETLSIHSIDHIVGEGKILILFICHSGSSRSDFFSNKTNSLVKAFLQNGYQAVIAPFWALHIDIPPIWLPEFLENILKGACVGTAFHRANNKVATIYNTPNAYACLHLFGNPFVKYMV